MMLFAGPDTPRLTVCEVLASDPTQFNGKTVAVRGKLVSNGEGMWLSGECKTHLVTKGLEWANTLSVRLNQSYPGTIESWRHLLEQLRRGHANIIRDSVYVTLV